MVSGEEIKLEARVACLRFPRQPGHNHWVPWEKRHAGKRNPPPDVAPDSAVRCKLCPGESHYAEYTGERRVKEKTQ